ncbi:deoxyuridine 5'-triphosphate nucleotidohydrolase [Acanthamoeba castellanii str. Neff]|uniref:Deoxyuridine 5'-triphosphate nucleotidohydrolase n=1 Tax=Acanthamoeba castellanii (strain ATCC 30010 / Neff) TaxID=1257118 RepID=L8GN62_ACACF|nr:deoxyuridine 5'-triphosphate nucleotidohydrolase [Acanthamoeba castellanii str. Neff]ELR14269.1 deoxyuridine 5'-triphosphate nucleotidohydrolase [Acanthamoeba castellanii str. Neff]
MSQQLVLRVKRLSPNAVLPFRATVGAAGYDLCSSENCVVPGRGKALVSTDLAMAIPPDHYGRIAPRSSVSWKNHVDVGAGVIDADYRGHVKVCLFNHADADFTIQQGDKIAQLIVERISLPDVEEVDDIDATVRGEGGFGSTGVSSKH